MSEQEKQCRICLDGTEVQNELGRLIRPCLCKGSISCLQKWRNTSPSKSAFFSCPQCHYKYRFSRTRAVGLATQPTTVAALSTIFFVTLVMVASYVTTFFIAAFERPTYGYNFFWYISPIEVVQDLVTAVFRIIRDGDMADILNDTPLNTPPGVPLTPKPPAGLVKRFIRRFLLGLPLVGAGSLVHMVLSIQALAPVQWIARYRAGRSRRENNSKDIAALIVIALLLFGALRALFKVYQLTESLTKRLLLRAEDAILEVN